MIATPAGFVAPRRRPVGAEVTADGASFRLWAPGRQRVRVVIEPRQPTAREVDLVPDAEGYFAGVVAGTPAGTRYRYRLDDEPAMYPDPASRSQPDGPHGDSVVIDATTFFWTDQAWHGVDPRGQVLYELHIGTFTPEGTWNAAARELPELARLGVTVIEMMPVAEFPGRFGWGYDGVDLFAPTRLYGTPDDLRRFVDRAHALGLGVLLDVVYNHLGPDGCYLATYSPHYFSQQETEWGRAINYDGAHSAPVREFVVSNAAYWIDEFHFDGLRLDATQSIADTSTVHVIAELADAVRHAGATRRTFLVAENEPQHIRLVQDRERGGYGLDALWNDDFHHAAMVALSGRAEAYYSDYCGTPQEFISAAKYGFLYQGQRYRWQRQRRGTASLDQPPWSFVTFLENHDQVANAVWGRRCHQLTSPGRYRAMSALLLLGPATPMLFQGQEFASSRPFLFFADYDGELARAYRRGRREFLAQFRSTDTPDALASLADPTALETFLASKLELAERHLHRAAYALHRDLLQLRHRDPVFQSQRRGGLDGAVLGPRSFVLRYFAGDLARAVPAGQALTASDPGDRLLLVNLGMDLHFDPAPEPLLAPPQALGWSLIWSSEDPRYGGSGTAAVDTDDNWLVPGESAIVLAATSAAAPAPAAGVPRLTS